LFKQYLKDQSGQFAIMLAVSAMALIIAVGAAIDITAMQKEKATLQAMTDSAALAAAISKSENVGELKKIAKVAADSNNFSGMKYKLDLQLDDKLIRVSAKTKYKTQLMGILGIKDVSVGALTETPLPKDIPLNVALVLDSTGSMDGANMIALKSASKKLIDVFDQADPGSIRAGVVPYSNYVNVGLDNRSRNWMDVPDDNTTTSPEECYMTRDIVDSSKCSTASNSGTCYNDSGAYSCDKSSQTCSDDAYGPEYETCYIPTSSQTWYGCVGSRDNPRHKEPAYKGKKFPGIMNVECGSEILDLTTDLSDIAAKIDSLIATGYTYIPAGLAWGWRMLDPNLPYGGLTNNQADRKRALVLMTDGANTVSLSAPHHNNDPEQNDAIATNALTQELCNGIKEDGIALYTVSYKLGSGDPVAEKMITDCATSPSYHFSANSQAELEEAFDDIARSLFEVWISK